MQMLVEVLFQVLPKILSQGFFILCLLLFSYCIYHTFKAGIASNRMSRGINRKLRQQNREPLFYYQAHSKQEVALHTDDPEDLKWADKYEHHKRKAVYSFATLWGIVILMIVLVTTLGECVKSDRTISCSLRPQHSTQQ